MPMVRLHSADDSIEAHLLKHMLEQQRIPAFITGEHLEGAVGELPAGGVVDVWVLDEHFDDARDVLEDFFDTLDDPEYDDELMDDDGYYLDDQEPEHERPAHNDPDNPWNRVYRRKKEDKP
ncbi:MAG: DUF2007 domain-containing protein [Pseudomonadota bacterium]